MARKSKYTKEVIEKALDGSVTYSEICQKLGLRSTGGNRKMVKSRIIQHGLDDSHLKGRAWAEGRTRNDHEGLAQKGNQSKIPDELVYCENTALMAGSSIRKRVLRDNKIEYKCSCCGITDWQDQPLALHLDHINGNNIDNRIENLRFLCPNCHQQTETWGNKVRNIKEP